jgi:hypothetical protein
METPWAEGVIEMIVGMACGDHRCVLSHLEDAFGVLDDPGASNDASSLPFPSPKKPKRKTLHVRLPSSSLN